MNDYSELKRLAEACLQNQLVPDMENPKWSLAHACIQEFEMSVSPEIVMALIAENEELGRYLCTCRDCGGEGALHTGEWHYYGHMDPPEPIMEKCGECDGTGMLGETQDLYQAITERDQLKAENLHLHRDLGRAGRNLHEAVEPLRRDAERYRWLRDGASVILSESVGFTAESGARIYSTMPTQRELDSAIDAAMSKEPNQ